MDTVTFEILHWASKAADLLERARQTLLNQPSDKVRVLAERIPSTLTSEGEKVKVVFAGQYSSGKSTILRALTGREDIAVGADIVTEKATEYEWEGLSVVDTPGIHTEIRPDHDEITYRAIAEADLLVFVITNELFDSRLAEHFRNLAIEREKAHEMMLVVNKMRRCAAGNTPEAQKVILEDLRKVLDPYSPEDLRTSFIDAKAALESKTKRDEHIARALWNKSGFDRFVNELNRFVRDKGLAARYTTSLYTLEQVLQEALAAESTGDTDVDALEEVLLQRRRALMETEQRVLRGVEGEIHRTAARVREEGRRCAELIHLKADKEDVDRELEAAQKRVEAYAQELIGTIEQVIATDLKDFDDRIDAITNSELAHELLPRLKRRLEDQRTSVEISNRTKSTMAKGANVSAELGKFLVRYSFKGEMASLASFLKLSHYSGTEIHELVEAIGSFFGKSFKPWEAVKWTRFIANVGRVLAIAGTFLTIVLQIKEDAEAEKMERELREARSAVRSGFNEAAHVIELRFDNATKTYVAETLAPVLREVDEQLEELRHMQQVRGKLFQDIMGLLEETRSLISTLHSNAL